MRHRAGVGARPGRDQAASCSIEGTLETIVFHSQETGFTVGHVMRDGVGRATVVGSMPDARVGSRYRFHGRWAQHPQFGRQFAFEEHEERLPATVDGIRRYLGSSLVQGVGPVTADKIVDHFGLETLEVIENEPGRLTEVPGVGPTRVARILSAWNDQRRVKEIMLFLQSYGVSAGLAVRIYKVYGDAALAIVRSDPYRLAFPERRSAPTTGGVYGVGFKTADAIARAMGLPADAPTRIEAGLLHALGELADEGHVFAPQPVLVEAARALLALESGSVPGPVPGASAGAGSAEVIAPRVDALIEAGHIVGEMLPAGPASGGSIPPTGAEGGPRGEDGASHDRRVERALYLPPLHRAEVGVASSLRRLLESRVDNLARWRETDWPATFDWLDRQSPYPLAERQREAARAALTSPVAVLTGGPGTGKTTAVRSVLQLLAQRKGSALLAAPTGRAAKRLSETTGVEAKTIHRLLEFKPSEGVMFQRNAEHPLEADLIVIDETSMLDTHLMHSLVQAIADGTHLLLVGDVDQLPSVGPGNVLRDVIASGCVPTVALDQVFRQSERSHIISNAHRINRGELPVLDPATSDDFFLFSAREPEAAAERLVEVVADRIPRRFGLDPLSDVQVLSPMHRGACGVAALNERLQAVLNGPAPDKLETRHAGRVLRVGDKVMQIRNNYEKDVFNGDLGRLVEIDSLEKTVCVAFEARAVDYKFAELGELVHAFACSVHKSQGAEYPCVVLALLRSHWMMLQRNLLYTAVTRAKRLCVTVGNRDAIARSVLNDRVAMRHTALALRLAESVGAGKS